MMKRNSRSARRGAVFVESIVVVAFFTLCFLGVVYFRELYVGKLRVQRFARASAMAHAMNACSGDLSAGLEADIGNGPAPSGSAHDDDNPKPPPDRGAQAQQSLDAFPETKKGTPLDTITAVTLKTSAMATTKNDPTSPGQEFKSDVTSASFVTCGDPVRNGGIEEIFPAIGDVFKSLFGN